MRPPRTFPLFPSTTLFQSLLVRQYRYATGGWLLEIPAGKLDHGESPETCAGREAQEEVGYRPSKLEPLGWIWRSEEHTAELQSPVQRVCRPLLEKKKLTLH